MRPSDVYRLANANLWRTRLRTVLTTLGVIVGIGALVSMVSFGVGMQKNITDEIRRHDLFTTIQVTPADLDLEGVMSGDVSSVAGPRDPSVPVLDDQAVDDIRAMPGVLVAFPEVRFPATIRFNGREARVNVQALPSDMGLHPPFDEIEHGRFFTSDDERSIVLGERTLRELGLRLRESGREPVSEGVESQEALAVVSADSLLGRGVVLVSSVLDESRVPHAMATGSMPLREVETTLTIVGMRERSSGFGFARMAPDATVPSGTGREIPRLGFTSIWDLLASGGEAETEYPAVHVRVESMDDLESVRWAIEERGFSVLALADQLEEFRRQFLIMDALLGAVGTIALFVASLGIINTMVTSILERRREIGVMKAVGGSQGDIKGIFFVEAGTIGLVGGALGLVLGWLVTRVANAVLNYHLRPEGVPFTDLFHMPAWLVLGALTFAVLVSLLAGVYPAARAARVDPVEALRHD